MSITTSLIISHQKIMFLHKNKNQKIFLSFRLPSLPFILSHHMLKKICLEDIVAKSFSDNAETFCIIQNKPLPKDVSKVKIM